MNLPSSSIAPAFTQLLPEGLHLVRVLPGDGAVDGLGVELAELVDVVALAGVPPPGEGHEVLRPVEVVLPQPVVVHHRVGVAVHEVLPLLLGHHAEDGGDAVLPAPVVDVVQGGVHIPHPRQGDGVVEDVAEVVALVEDHQAAVALGEGRVPVLAPHELHPRGVFAQAIVALAVVLAQPGHVFQLHGSEFQHNILTFPLLLSPCSPRCER